MTSKNLPAMFYENLDLRQKFGSDTTSWWFFVIYFPGRWAHLAIFGNGMLVLVFWGISKWAGDFILWVMSTLYVFYILGAVIASSAIRVSRQNMLKTFNTRMVINMLHAIYYPLIWPLWDHSAILGTFSGPSWISSTSPCKNSCSEIEFSTWRLVCDWWIWPQQRLSEDIVLRGALGMSIHYRLNRRPFIVPQLAAQKHCYL